MTYTVVYIKGSGLNVEIPSPSVIKVKGVLREGTLSFLGKNTQIMKLGNQYGEVILKGIALNVRYVSRDLVIIEGLLKDYEVRPSENLVTTLYTFEENTLPEPDLDEF